MTKAIVGAFGVAVAAFAVWLMVRILNRRERWAKWTAAALLFVLVLYPLSAGPSTWLLHHGDLPKPAFRFVLAIYEPLAFVVENLPEALNNAVREYQGFFVNFGGPSHLRR
jgi:hypothetical protein